MYSIEQRRQRRRLFWATLCILALFVIDLVSGGMIRHPARALAASVWGASDTILTRISGSGLFATHAQLAHENEALSTEVASLKEQLAAEQAAVAEDQQLQSMVHLAQSVPGISARVTSSFKASPYGTFLIGVGTTDGIQKGALVLSAEGFVLGRIAEVQDHQSLVKELFAPNEKVGALAGVVPLTLTGKGGGNAEGDAPRGTQIATDTPVVAPALEGRTVGVVGLARGDAASASVKVYVRTPVNLETLQFVYVTK